MLDEYIIMGSEATCTKCDRKMNMGNSYLLNEIELFGHCLSHIGMKKNVLYLPKRAKIDFVLLGLFH